MYVLRASIAVGSLSARRSTLATRSVGTSSRSVSHRGRVTVTYPSVTSYPGMSFASTQLRTTMGISQTSCVDFRGHQGSVSRIVATLHEKVVIVSATVAAVGFSIGTVGNAVTRTASVSAISRYSSSSRPLVSACVSLSISSRCAVKSILADTHATLS